MNFKYIRNCLTCEFGFDNCTHDQDWNRILPDKLVIKCDGNNELYGKEVKYKSVCENWTVGLEEFSRVEKKICYADYYKEELDLLEK